MALPPVNLNVSGTVKEFENVLLQLCVIVCREDISGHAVRPLCELADGLRHDRRPRQGPRYLSSHFWLYVSLRLSGEGNFEERKRKAEIKGKMKKRPYHGKRKFQKWKMGQW